MTITVATNRYSTSNVIQPKKGVVVHTSESGDGSLQSLLSLLQVTGTKPIPNSSPVRYMGSAYHALADGSTGDYIQVLPGSAGPYAAPPLNKTWWHICMPGRAAQTRDEWLDPMSRGQIRAVARFIVDRAKVDGFPLERRTVAELQAGLGGYCGHVDVTYAFHDSTHIDPGVNFPWDVLAADIAYFTSPTPKPDPQPPTLEDSMQVARHILFDSREHGDRIPAGTPLPLPIAGAAGHKAVTLKVTVIQPHTTGYLTFGPDTTTGKDIPDVNIVEAGVAASDTTVVPLVDVLGGKGVAFSCSTTAHIQITLLAFND